MTEVERKSSRTNRRRQSLSLCSQKKRQTERGCTLINKLSKGLNGGDGMDFERKC